jgi:hypothetical protein
MKYLMTIEKDLQIIVLYPVMVNKLSHKSLILKSTINPLKPTKLKLLLQVFCLHLYGELQMLNLFLDAKSLLSLISSQEIAISVIWVSFQ